MTTYELETGTLGFIEVEQDIKQAIQIGMIEWEQQQVSITVEKALEVVIDKGRAKYGSTFLGDYPIIDKQSILSLKTQILEELKGGEGDENH